jgi:hypothetical protein
MTPKQKLLTLNLSSNVPLSLKLNVLYLSYQNYKNQKSTCAYNFDHLHKWMLKNSANQDRGQPN